MYIFTFSSLNFESGICLFVCFFNIENQTNILDGIDEELKGMHECTRRHTNILHGIVNWKACMNEHASTQR